MQTKIKFNSKVFILSIERAVKVERPPMKNKYRKLNIMNIAPNWVQKNIR
jgi:hypothetical protein